MTDDTVGTPPIHLPECIVNDPYDRDEISPYEMEVTCEEYGICDRLKECEKRVRDRCAMEIDHGPQMGNSLEWMLNPIRQHHYERGVKDATDRLWRYFKDNCGPITGKGMTAGPVCVDEAVAITGGEKP